MLTVDLVAARRRGDELKLQLLDKGQRGRALELAELFVAIGRAHVGRTREEYEEACAAVEVLPHERRLGDGLRKLVEDRCAFDADETLDPPSLRRELFMRSAALRRELPDGKSFDEEHRAQVIAAAAEALGTSAEKLEASLFADLRSAHVMTEMRPTSAALLVDGYDLAQAQAVLLRAVRVNVEVECAAPGGYRALFNKLKFLRLLHRIDRFHRPAPAAGGERRTRAQGEKGTSGFCIEIDGPFSLFESVTRYGLQLALALPAIAACDRWRLVADLRWGKERQPLSFKLDGGGQKEAGAEVEKPRLSDEVQALLDGLLALETRWKVSPATDILDVAGVGVCVPDLVFEKKRSKERVYLEVMGFWSREAVWKRVELVEKGLPARILFCVGQQLRVGEAALPEDVPAALLVYKNRIGAKAVMEKIEALGGGVARR